jgi:hypothetical protein
MMPSNDNQALTEAARVLPVLGRVDPSGAIVLHASVPRPEPGDRAAVVDCFPNDPRET